MFRFVVKRVFLTIPVLLAIALIIFTIMSFTPGDPGHLILGYEADPAAVEQLNHKLGYDQPFVTRFIEYIKNIVLHFDFGISYRTQKAVMSELMSKFPTTLLLALVSISLSSFIGVLTGVVSAVRHNSVVDMTVSTTAICFSAIPAFWFGMMLLYIFALKLGFLPSGGISSWKSYIMPVLTVSLGPTASIMRMTRATMLETIHQDYITTARAKGASKRIIVFKHALKNALLPIVTSMGMTFGSMLGGAVIAESVFSMPGIGTYVLDAIRAKDVPVVMTGVLFIAALFCFVMLCVDILTAFLDPRVKAKYAK